MRSATGRTRFNGTNGTSLTAYTLNPVAGLWTLVVVFANPVVGNEVSQPFTGDIKFNDVSARAFGLPNSASTTLPAGAPITVPVNVTNNGAAPEDFLIDARLDATGSISLASLSPSSGLSLPLVGLAPNLVGADRNLEHLRRGDREPARNVRFQSLFR